MNEEKKKHIPGIYNYCDRWCEKCSFTSYCLLFSNESKIATFEILNDRLPEAEEIMDELFETDEKEFEDEIDEGFSIEEPDEDFLFDNSDEDEEEMELEENENEHANLIEDLSNEYLKQSQVLIKSIDEKFNFSSTPKENLPIPQIKKIYDIFETVSWHHAFIFIKIKRASQGKKEYLKYKDKDLKEFSKYDSDGTAKVAALSIKNSIKAITELQEYLPDYSVELLKLSSLLMRIFNELEVEFPGYKNFKRPGFDD